MSHSISSLKSQMHTAQDLRAVVHTMKAMAARNIHQYEQAVSALDEYFKIIQLGLGACFQPDFNPTPIISSPSDVFKTNQSIQKAGLVFGSDQGLVGQFNEHLAEFVCLDFEGQAATSMIWPIGERIAARLSQSHLQANLTLHKGFALPRSTQSIAPLVGEILLSMEAFRAKGAINEVVLFYNQPNEQTLLSKSLYTPVKFPLLPMDRQWQAELIQRAWPTANIPEVINTAEHDDQFDHLNSATNKTQLAFIHEYLFVAIYRACADSLASENASRLAAMQRAEKNIDALLLNMNRRFHRLRQSGIDEELFDVIAGFHGRPLV